MKAKSINGNSVEEIKTALSKILAEGLKPTLAIVFISVKQDRKAVVEVLRNHDMDVFGATSCGEFIDGHQSEGSIAILLLDLSRENYAVLFEDAADSTIWEAGRKLSQAANQKFKNHSFILCSTGVNTKGEYLDGETVVQAIKTHSGDNIVFFGGQAGDDMTLAGTYVFTNEKETDYGLVAIVLDTDKVATHGLANTGWKPMGISRTITKSKGNLVYTIDNKPAVEMYLKYLGSKDSLFDTSVGLMTDLSLHYPFIVERKSGETVLRTPLSINKQEMALQMNIAMEEGTKFWFTMPPDFDIVDEVLGNAVNVKKDYQAEALLVFSCAGRINVLGPLVNSENEGLHNIWNTPMAGFFTYGEFGIDSKDNMEFHSGACSWVALKEK